MVPVDMKLVYVVCTLVLLFLKNPPKKQQQPPFFLCRFPQPLSGHKHSVRCLSFSSSSMLCSGTLSGEVRVWSVPTSTCVGCFQAHCGSTEALTFLDEGSMLLSAGSDHMVRQEEFKGTILKQQQHLLPLT